MVKRDLANAERSIRWAAGHPTIDIGSTAVAVFCGVTLCQLNHRAIAAIAITPTIPPHATSVILRATLRLCCLTFNCLFILLTLFAVRNLLR